MVGSLAGPLGCGAGAAVGGVLNLAVDVWTGHNIYFNEDASDYGEQCPVPGGEHDTTNGLGTDFWDVPGSYEDAVGAAKGLTNGNLTNKGNGVQVGVDSNGNTVIVRPGGGGNFRGNPANGTIEIQPPGGGTPTDKVRYR